MATQAGEIVAITGGSITGITDIAVSDGGTGASDVATARQNLGLEIGVDVQAYDADLADLADGELSASKVQYAITSEGTSGQVWTSDGDGAGDWVANSAASDIDGLSDAKVGGDNFTGSLIVGHETTGTLNNAQYNTGVGLATLDAITTGDYNTAIGFSALSANTTGVSNTASGFNALFTNTTGARNTATGYRSLHTSTSIPFQTPASSGAPKPARPVLDPQIKFLSCDLVTNSWTHSINCRVISNPSMLLKFYL